MEEERKIEELQRLIDTHENIVFFGGAGVSTESGIPDFRSVDGLYHQKYDVPPETILSHSYFLRYPEKFYAFYRDKMLPVGAKPNAAHKKLAELEAAGKLKAVVTQNIDGLHQAAGSKSVYELHGSIHRNYCMKCGAACDTELVRKRQRRSEDSEKMRRHDQAGCRSLRGELERESARRSDPLDCGGRSSDCRRNVTCGLSGGRPSPVF